MLRLFPIILLINVSAFGQEVKLSCDETTALIYAMQTRLREVDAKRRETFGSVPLLFQGIGYEPLQYYAEGRETRQVVKVDMNRKLVVLKQFQTVAAAVSFAAQMNALQSQGIEGVQVVGGVDTAQRIVPVKHHQLVSLEWLNEEDFPSGFLPYLRRVRRHTADEVNDIGGRYQILEERVDARDLYLDLDSESFRLIDIK